ncbi:sigma-70 family RNA polymerase sigma factor [bacterium]|nr:sigma-70 family RNA polymerase sigma factor [bacterium]
MADVTGLEGTDDNYWIDRVLAGETEAFGVLVKRYQQKMFRVAYRITLEAAEAEDVTQQAFLKAFLHLQRFRRQSAFSTWLYRITCNIALNSYKAKQRMKPGTGEADLISFEHGLTTIERTEEVTAVRKAIRALPKRQRLTLVLRMYEQLPFKEIAAILRCSEGGAKANYFQAIVKMKKLLTSFVLIKE